MVENVWPWQKNCYNKGNYLTQIKWLVDMLSNEMTGDHIHAAQPLRQVNILLNQIPQNHMHDSQTLRQMDILLNQMAQDHIHVAQRLVQAQKVFLRMN